MGALSEQLSERFYFSELFSVEELFDERQIAKRVVQASPEEA